MDPGNGKVSHLHEAQRTTNQDTGFLLNSFLKYVCSIIFMLNDIAPVGLVVGNLSSHREVSLYISLIMKPRCKNCINSTNLFLLAREVLVPGNRNGSSSCFTLYRGFHNSHSIAGLNIDWSRGSVAGVFHT